MLIATIKQQTAHGKSNMSINGENSVDLAILNARIAETDFDGHPPPGCPISPAGAQELHSGGDITMSFADDLPEVANIPKMNVQFNEVNSAPSQEHENNIPFRLG